MSRCDGCIWFLPKWFRCSKFHLWIWDVGKLCEKDEDSPICTKASPASMGIYTKEEPFKNLSKPFKEADDD